MVAAALRPECLLFSFLLFKSSPKRKRARREESELWAALPSEASRSACPFLLLGLLRPGSAFIAPPGTARGGWGGARAGGGAGRRRGGACGARGPELAGG